LSFQVVLCITGYFLPEKKFILFATKVSGKNAAWFELLLNANTAIQIGNKASKIGIAFNFTCSNK